MDSTAITLADMAAVAKSTPSYMDANGLKCSGYNNEGGYMKLYLVDATVEDVKAVNWDHLDMATSAGTVFLSSDSYTLESAQLNMFDDTLVVNLRNVDDPTYAKVTKVADAVKDQQTQLDIQGDAIDAIIGMLG